ncbi:short chain dehydrogenase [Schizosaccharomyces japonicus yFS275]|uniref:Short chain dehydrogenase n=1 Tax=Schizosaccharomyces japonicus (strain yFS275 / FY16936) TaxID=402676 RepID=B6K5Q2_SCHJY|nr:short chain dehydrogenase [Schizosaccharomyces japonicus yFS275]EEB08856.1 short chain dehydrogenase [Schizosaccharomyces japonicus yFS275]
MSRLEGKTIFITGASAGIGKSTAIELAKTAKVKLILAARRLPLVEELKKEIESKYEGVKVLPLKLDVSKIETIEPTIASLPEEFANVDILINNAGLALGISTVQTLDMQEALTMINTNVVGLIAMSKAVLQIFYKNGGKGDIVNIGSTAGQESYKGGSVYCCTKSAVTQFTSALRKETLDTRIRIIEVDPGMVETDFSLTRFHGDKSKADSVYQGTEPLVAQDIAEVIVFCVSRRENTVIAHTTVLPSHQATSNSVYRKSA